jgi:hypothetical protein
LESRFSLRAIIKSFLKYKPIIEAKSLKIDTNRRLNEKSSKNCCGKVRKRKSDEKKFEKLMHTIQKAG